jgi:hypothetical protein
MRACRTIGVSAKVQRYRDVREVLEAITGSTLLPVSTMRP